jgi:serine protease Do
MKRLVLTAMLSLLPFLGSAMFQNALAANPPVQQSSLAPILKPIMPAVVNIAAQGEIMVPTPLKRGRPDPRNNNDDSDDFGAPSPYGALKEFASLGSGVILDAGKGYILTNAHVVDKAKIITVTLSDGRSIKAKLVGSDALSDIAVIQIPVDKLEKLNQTEKLTAMPLGNSDKLSVGDYAIAIGSPFGLTQTVTSGIISALQRGSLGIEGHNGVENFIQTDASINPGNSGGALVNMQGELIGINTAILSPEGGNIGIGFAIPINLARTIAAQLIEYGSVKRGLMGIIVQDLTPDLAAAFNQPNIKGALISQVTPNSPAAKSGLQPGDIVEELNGEKIETAAAVRNAVGILRVGANIELTLLRQGKTVDVKVTTADPEQYLEKTQKQNPFLFGLSFKDFDQQTPMQGRVIGVQIVYVSKNSAAWRAGLIPGDVIVSANQMIVKNIANLQEAAAKNDKHLLLNVLRGSAAMFVVLD